MCLIYYLCIRYIIHLRFAIFLLVYFFKSNREFKLGRMFFTSLEKLFLFSRESNFRILKCLSVKQEYFFKSILLNNLDMSVNETSPVYVILKKEETSSKNSTKTAA